MKTLCALLAVFCAGEEFPQPQAEFSLIEAKRICFADTQKCRAIDPGENLEIYFSWHGSSSAGCTIRSGEPYDAICAPGATQ